ncbi:hypothetical protein ACTXG6_13975 [Pseudonocardia sp. Cha107L01]|uniref:hypothetical protein n=1 Tax=Pseudonocardia sp. Cha107L01 TaxID=3457576 RepID=UPI00403ED3AE
MHRPAQLRRAPRGVAAAALTVAAGLLATLLAGCGAGTPAGAPAAPPAPPLVKYTTLAQLGTATGTQMKADRTAKLTVTGGSSGGPAQATTNGDGAISFDPTGSSMRLTEQVQPAGAPTPLELGFVVLPDEAYVKPPPGVGFPIPPGKSWLRIQPNATDPVSQQFGQLVQALRANADPTLSFTRFGDAATIVSSAEDPLDGAPAVRYLIRVDVAKAAAQAQDPTVAQSLRQTVQNGVSAVESSLWLDARNHPLRVLLAQPLPAGQGTYTVEARYREWGQPVQISAPPADQVAPS